MQWFCIEAFNVENFEFCIATGNVLKVQKMLHICSDHYDTKDQVNKMFIIFILPASLSSKSEN